MSEKKINFVRFCALFCHCALFCALKNGTFSIISLTSFYIFQANKYQLSSSRNQLSNIFYQLCSFFCTCHGYGTAFEALFDIIKSQQGQAQKKNQNKRRNANDNQLHQQDHRNDQGGGKGRK